MKKLYEIPSVKITEIRSESVITVSGPENPGYAKASNFVFGEGKNTINFS